MTRSSIRLAAVLASASSLLAAAPAFAQDDATDAAVGVGFLACWGVLILLGLVLYVLNIWMLVDALGRQEYEYPNSTGSSKNLWVILLVVGLVVGFGWIAALVYYFNVYKKVRRGTVAPPWAQTAPPAPPQSYAPPPPIAPSASPAPPVEPPPAPQPYTPSAPVAPAPSPVPPPAPVMPEPSAPPPAEPAVPAEEPPAPPQEPEF